MKIVSLIPSATEIVCSLGLIDNLVGISHECDYPRGIEKLPQLTRSKVDVNETSYNINENIQSILEKGLSVYEVDSDLLQKIDPDVIITQSHCSVCAVSIEDVKKCLNLWLKKKPILIDLKPNYFKDVISDILFVGEKLNAPNEALKVVEMINKEINVIKKKLNSTNTKNVLCIEWIEPLMIAGNWIPEILRISNADNILIESGKNSKFVSLGELSQNKFDIVIFMPCGFDIRRTKLEIKKSNLDFHSLFKHKEVFAVDGNKFFNRPGPRLLESIKILCEIIHPGIFRPEPSLERWEAIKLSG